MTMAQIGALLDGHIGLDRADTARAIAVAKLGMHGSADDIARFTDSQSGSGKGNGFADLQESMAAFGVKEVPT